MGFASILAAQAPAPTPPSPPAGRQSFTVDSKILGETRRINVSLPPGYEQGGGRFPVLYMPDGGMEEDFPHVSATVRSLEDAEAVRPFLVVGIENTERRRDLTGPTEVSSDRKIAPRVGGSAAFRRFLRDELMPEIRRRYRTTGETAIVGESLAGLFVVEAFFLEPDLFDTYIALDPSLWWNGGALVRAARETLKARPGLFKTLYLSCSDEPGIISGTESLAAALQAAAPPGIVWFYEPMPQEHHDTIFRAAEARAYRTVFAAAPRGPRAQPVER